MATIPPGNKQVGEYVADTAYGLLNGYNMSRLRNILPYVVTNDPNTTNPIAPAPFGIGEAVYDVAYDKGDNTVHAYGLLSYVLVKEPERHITKVYNALAYMTVKDPTQDTSPVEGHKPFMIGENVYDVAYSPDGNINKCYGMIGMVLVKEIKLRKELTTFLVTLHDRKE